MASDSRLRKLRDLTDFEDNTSLSSMELSMYPARAPDPCPSPTIFSNTDAIDGFPPVEHPPSPPPSHHGSSPIIPTLILTTTSNTQIDDIDSPLVPEEDTTTENDNKEGRPRSILSILSRPLSAFSFRSGHSPPPWNTPPAPLDASSQSSNLSSSSHGLKKVFKGLIRRSRLTQVSPTTSIEVEDNISCTSGEEVSDSEASLTSTAVKRKMDSLAGSTYGESTDTEGEREGLRRNKKWTIGWCINKIKSRLKQFLKYRIDQHGTNYFLWLCIIALAVTYNAMAIPLRASFGEEVTDNGVFFMWLALDILCDIIYMMDVLGVQPRLCNEGCSGLDTKSPEVKRQLFIKHLKSFTFWADLFSVLPLDILYAVPSLRFNALLRMPRILKIHRVWTFQDRFESRTKYPNVFRVTKLVMYFLYIVHVYTCIYFSVSEREGFGTNEWVYNGDGASYLRCFYWAIQTITTAHNLDRGVPVTNLEYNIDLLGYLFSVFFLAIIFGEIRNIVEASSGPKRAAHKRWDRVRKYMSDWKLSPQLQRRVKAWYDYALTQELNLDEAKVFESLPPKMKADLAIHVHLNTLSKVALFKGCEKSLLRELVLRLEPVIFVPNDFICKRGEIGKEMYIVNKGLVQVIGGSPQNSRVLAELGPGSVFGEISMLAVGGGNRRTAHVVSKGFSSIFVLSKKDLQETLDEYPEAKETLREKARQLLKQDKKRNKKEEQQAKTEESLAENARLASKVKNNPAAKVAFMAFATAPAKVSAARAAAAKPSPEKEGQEGEESSLSEIHSIDTQTTIVEIHDEENPVITAAKLKMPASGSGATTAVRFKPSELKSTTVTQGLRYTSLWPSAKDVVITAAPPNTCPDKI